MLFGIMRLEKFFSAVGVKVFRAFSTIVKHCHCPILYGRLAARAQFLNDTMLDHSCGCQVVVYISQHGMAISFAAISNFFVDEMKLIECAENALKSNRLRGFTYDG